MPKVIIIKNHKKYGQMELIEVTGGGYGLYRCYCGEITISNIYDIEKGRVKSCGCLWRDVMHKHGGSKHYLYKIWSQMKDRCAHESSPCYHNYGLRGISVCDEWVDDFLEYAMHIVTLGKRYNDGLQIDRINNDKGYFPGNVRLASPQQNSWNTRPRGGSSKYKGVSLDKARGKWKVRIKVSYSEIFIGRFKNELDAAKAYDEKAEELHGEFAWLNRDHFEEIQGGASA